MFSIIARAPYEATSYAEPRETVHVVRSGILNARYALKLAQIEASREDCYDVSFEVLDARGKQVRLADFDAAAHVHAFRMHRDYGIDADFPF